MVPERQVWSSLHQLPPDSWPSAVPAAEKRGAEGMAERSGPSWVHYTWLRLLCLPHPLPAPSPAAWGQWVLPGPAPPPCLLFLYFI